MGPVQAWSCLFCPDCLISVPSRKSVAHIKVILVCGKEERREVERERRRRKPKGKKKRGRRRKKEEEAVESSQGKFASIKFKTI